MSFLIGFTKNALVVVGVKGELLFAHRTIALLPCAVLDAPIVIESVPAARPPAFFPIIIAFAPGLLAPTLLPIKIDPVPREKLYQWIAV